MIPSAIDGFPTGIRLRPGLRMAFAVGRGDGSGAAVVFLDIPAIPDARRPGEITCQRRARFGGPLQFDGPDKNAGRLAGRQVADEPFTPYRAER